MKPFTPNPTLSKNHLIAPFQLLIWIIFHPTALHHYLNAADPPLTTQTCLAQLRHTHLTDPRVRHLLITMFITTPALMTLPILFTVPTWHRIIGALVVTTCIMGVFAVIISFITGYTTILITLPVFLITITQPGSTVASIIEAPTFGIAYGATLGAILYGAFQPNSNPTTPVRLRRRLGQYLVSTLYIILSVFIVLVVVKTLAIFWDQAQFSKTGVLLTIVIIAATAYTIALRIRGIGWRNTLIFALILGCGITASTAPYIDQAGLDSDIIGVEWIILTLIVASIVFTFLFMFSYGFTRTFTSERTSLIIGAMSGALIWILLAEVFQFFDGQINMRYGFTLMVLGATGTLWRPILTYPFQWLYGELLYLLNADADPFSLHALRWHPAFWDDHQWIPWYKLDDKLVVLHTADPKSAQTAFATLFNGYQRWATQSAQVELDARELEQCSDITAIAHIHTTIGHSELSSPARAILNTFVTFSHDVEAALAQSTTYNKRVALQVTADQLNQFLRDLVRSSEPYAPRFQPITAYWHQLILRETTTLQQTSELRQEIPDPYITGVPLTHLQELFVGRTDISERIENLINQDQQAPLVLYGQRRMGKTSLLYNLSRLLPSHILPIFVDLQGIPARTNAGFFNRLAKQMIRSAQNQRHITLPPFTATDDPVIQFLDWIEALITLTKQHGIRTILLTLDEFETLDELLKLGKLDDSIILGTLRHIIQHHPQIRVMVAGSHSLNEFQHWSSFFINARVLHLGRLTRTETLRLITQPTEQFVLNYEPSAAEHVYTLTAGHPYLTQLLCSEIIYIKNQQPITTRRLVTPQDVEQAIPPTLERGALFFHYITAYQLTPYPQASTMLTQLAQTGRIGTDVDTPDTLTYLVEKELLEVTAGTYHFTVPLIGRWFSQSS